MDIRPKDQRDKLTAIFLTYNGLLEPLLFSQAIAYLKELSRELSLKITVLSFEKVGCWLNPKDRKRIRLLNNELRKCNINWYWFRYHKKPPVISSCYDVLVGIIATSILLMKMNVSIIHARSYVPGFIALVLHKLFGRKYIFDMRGFMIDDYAALESISPDGLLFRLAKRLERSIVKNADAVIVLTENARRSFGNFIKLENDKLDSISVIPCCVDEKRFNPHAGKNSALLKDLHLEGKFVFVYVGSLGKLYQFDKMLDFFSESVEIVLNAQLLLITPDIEFIIQQKSLYPNQAIFKQISYCKVEPGKVADYISLGDVGMAFYLASPSRVGTSPTKIGEYLASGIPFLANAGIGDVADWARNYKVGVIVERFTKDCYRKAINELMTLTKDKSILSLRCQEAARELLALDIAKQRYTKIYAGLLESVRE